MTVVTAAAPSTPCVRSSAGFTGARPRAAVRPVGAGPFAVALGVANTPAADEIDGVCTQRRYAASEHLFHTGHAGEALYAVESGLIKLYAVANTGEEQVLGFCLPGELFGLDALGSATRHCSAVALEAAVVHRLPVSALDAMCRRTPGLQRRLHQLIGRRLGDIHELLMLLGQKRAEERLASFLVDLISRGPAQARELRLGMSRDDIGHYLGLALETVSRLFRRLHDDGLIRAEGRRVRIEDMSGLRALAGLPVTPGRFARL